MKCKTISRPGVTKKPNSQRSVVDKALVSDYSVNFGWVHVCCWDSETLDLLTRRCFNNVFCISIMAKTAYAKKEQKGSGCFGNRFQSVQQQKLH